MKNLYIRLLKLYHRYLDKKQDRVTERRERIYEKISDLKN